MAIKDYVYICMFGLTYLSLSTDINFVTVW